MSALPARPRLTRRRLPRSGQVLLSGRTRSGTEVYVAPMHGFATRHAILTTRYGSRDTCLPDGTALPEGLAHFLEHQMFQSPEGDLFDVYAERGASANAWTTFSSTSYLFACVDRFEENLGTLLESVSHLHVDADGVAREKEIIGQEIAMYDDDPSWRGYFNLLGALYRRHPVRIDIAGTPSSIAAVDPGILESAHRAFYHPRNLLLVVAGDVDPGLVLAEAEARLGGGRAGRRRRRKRAEEPHRVARREVRQALSVSRPHVLLGLKDVPARGGASLVRRQVDSALLLDVLLGDGGRIQAPLYEEGLVDDTLVAGYEAERDFGHAIVTAEVDEVEPFRRRLLAGLARASREGVGATEVARAKRKALGRYVRTFNAPESVGAWLLGNALEEVPVGLRLEAVLSASPARLGRRLRALAGAARAWSILTPRS